MSTGRRCLVHLALATAVACGGGNGEKERFVERANAICRETNLRLQGYARTSPPDATSSTDLVARYIVPALEDEIHKLRALEAPSSDRDEIEEILTERQSAVNHLKARPELLEQGQGRGDVFAAANARANAYGLTVCGRSAS